VGLAIAGFSLSLTLSVILLLSLFGQRLPLVVVPRRKASIGPQLHGRLLFAKKPGVIGEQRGY
jgi:hypothetical protein